MQQRLLRAFRADFPRPPKRLIVGFSGGSDSLALALLLKRIRSAIPTSIELVHVNHHLRSDSTEDADAATALANTLDLPLTIREIEGDVRALHPGVGIEEAARRERYLVLQAESGDDDVVVLGHHAQDQAETILLHLMRGAGLQGVAGMTRLSSIDIPWWERDEPAIALRIWRPLLAESRDELRSILSLFNLLPVEDPSNASETFRRNALRHRIVPVLRDIEPGAIDAIGRFGQIAADEDRLLTQLATEQRTQVSDGQDGLRVDRLLGLDVALRRRVVHQWLNERTGEPPSLDRVSALLTLAKSGSESSIVEMGRDRVAGIFRDVLRCGLSTTLDEFARQDAGLILPLWDESHGRSDEEINVVVRNNVVIAETIAIPQTPRGFEQISIRPVRDELIE